MLRGAGGGRLAISRVAGGAGGVGNTDKFDGGLGFVRGYLASIGAHKDFGSKSNLSDLNYLLANPRIRRFFSSEAPKKKSEQFFFFFLRKRFLFNLLEDFMDCGVSIGCVVTYNSGICLQIMRTFTPRKRRRFQKGMSTNLNPKVKFTL